MSAFPRDLVTDARGRVVRRPSGKTIERVVVVARELERIAGELAAIGIDAPTIEARFVALSIKHRRAYRWSGAEMASEVGRKHLAYIQHLCPGLIIGYRAGVFSVRERNAADEAVA
jgi:hypothetical protein